MDHLASIAADWIWRTNADHEIVSLRGRYADLTGRPVSAALGTPWPGLRAERSADEARRLLQARRPFHDLVVVHDHPDGTPRRFRLGGSPILARDGGFQGFRGVATELAPASHDETAGDAPPVPYHLLTAAIEQMPLGVHILDHDLRVAMANPRFLEIYGLSPDIVRPGAALEDVVRHSAEMGNYPGLTPDQAWAVTQTRIGIGYRIERILPRGRTVSLNYTPIRDGGYVVTHEDITHRKLAETQLEDQHRWLDTALAHMAHGLVLFDAAHRIVIFNRQFLVVHGLTADAVSVGMSAEELIRRRVAAGNFPGRSADEVWREVSPRINSRAAYRVEQTLHDGRTTAVSYSPTPDGGFVTMHEDITSRRQAEIHIAHMARHDALTDLPNRTMFREHLGATLRTCDEAAVLCLDLDRFKTVNDTLGHAVGDALLRRVAHRLERSIGRTRGRRAPLLARLGGDEFAIVVPRGRGRDIGAIAARLIEAVARDYEIDGQRLNVGLSIGIALAPQDGADPDRLIRAADMALYRAKAAGRSTFRFFQPEMEAAVQERRALELDLRHALAKEQFELYYQPFFSLHTNRVVGFEALVRWHHPTRGLVSPADFIPLAEETGLIVPLGEWVLRAACREAARWPEAMGISVNLSPAQFRGAALVPTVVSAIDEVGLDPTRLQLEITEGVLLQDNPGTLSALHALKALGVRIAMDDFGTGYSSLSYLQSFPFDTIKIDRSFVRDIALKTDAAAIVLAVTTLAPSLGMTTTAEGVETVAQMECLRAAGCDVAQGYLISRPRPAAEIQSLLVDVGRLRSAA